jgi:hypothetical protein
MVQSEVARKYTRPYSAIRTADFFGSSLRCHVQSPAQNCGADLHAPKRRCYITRRGTVLPVVRGCAPLFIVNEAPCVVLCPSHMICGYLESHGRRFGLFADISEVLLRWFTPPRRSSAIARLNGFCFALPCPPPHPSSVRLSMMHDSQSRWHL